ncbi:hypothetical protein MTR67_014509 [Solanum verrucosum]|uniref:Uncharacterized protein n=1 Tax=Solanum verrucosum TaxID=315347 RepID=A0AAF0QJN1_SOLVR|nr:hypothetical protein MTR67_014509 [Solanum verrucosum]
MSSLFPILFYFNFKSLYSLILFQPNIDEYRNHNFGILHCLLYSLSSPSARTRECEQDSKISPTRHLLVSVYNVYTHGVVICTYHHLANQYLWYHHLPNHVFVIHSLFETK